MKLKKIIIFFAICLTLSNSLEAKVMKWMPVKDFPSELTFLIESIQDYKLGKKESEDFFKELSLMDQIFGELTKEEIYFISKSEIYKSFLKINPEKKSYPIKYYNPEIVEKFKKALSKNKKKYSKFVLWIGYAIATDLENIFNSYNFPMLVIRKKNKRPYSSNQMKKLDKKFRLLIPWYDNFVIRDPEDLAKFIKDKMLSNLAHLNKISILLHKFSRFKKFKALKLAKEDFILFKLKDVSKIEVKMPTDEDILNSIKIPKVEKKPVLNAKKKWTPKEIKEGKAPLFPMADPNYIPPKTLPKPVDDWIIKF